MSNQLPTELEEELQRAGLERVTDEDRRDAEGAFLVGRAPLGVASFLLSHKRKAELQAKGLLPLDPKGAAQNA